MIKKFIKLKKIYNLKYLNAEISKVKPPINFVRKSKKLIEKKGIQMKYLLFYYIILFKDYCNPEVFRLLLLYSEIIKSLYGLKIYKENLITIQSKIELFKNLYEKILGITSCTANYHLLDHLIKDVVNFGPLWTHSTLPFENLFGKLNDFIFSSNINLKNINLFFILKIYIKGQLLNNNFENELIPLTKIFFKNKFKKISFIKNSNKIKYFKKKFDLYSVYYSKYFNKSKKFDSFLILLKNNEIVEIIKIYLANNKIFLTVKLENKLYNIEENNIEIPILMVNNYFIKIKEPISLI